MGPRRAGPGTDTSRLPTCRGGAVHNLGSKAEISPCSCTSCGFLRPLLDLSVPCLWDIPTDSRCSRAEGMSGLSTVDFRDMCVQGLGQARVCSPRAGPGAGLLLSFIGSGTGWVKERRVERKRERKQAFSKHKSKTKQLHWGIPPNIQRTYIRLTQNSPKRLKRKEHSLKHCMKPPSP